MAEQVVTVPVQVSARTGFLLSRLGAAARERFASALAPLGIRPAHYGALKLIEAHGPVPQQALAVGLGVDRSMIVGLVDHLETVGAVQRRPDPDDRRRHALHLTAHGRQLVHEADAIADDLHDQWLAPLEGVERAQLLGLLRRLADANLGRPRSGQSSHLDEVPATESKT
jgi:DNA-binding MarR family transcriptional regulator